MVAMQLHTFECSVYDKSQRSMYETLTLFINNILGINSYQKGKTSI